MTRTRKVRAVRSSTTSGNSGLHPWIARADPAFRGTHGVSSSPTGEPSGLLTVALLANSQAKLLARMLLRLPLGPRHFDHEGNIMSEQREHEAPALHSEVVVLRKRLEALEDRVTELEKELRETQEAASTD